MSLVGARVVRVDRPTRSLTSLELTGAGGTVLLVSTTRGAEGLGLVRRRPRGMPIDAFGLLLRKRLVSARLLALEANAGGSRLVFDTDEGWVLLEARHDRDARGFAFLDADARIVAATYPDASPLDPREVVDESTLHEAGSAITSATSVLARAARTKAVATAIASALTRAERKLVALERDAARADRAPELRREADLLVASATDDRPGRTSTTVLDFHEDPPMERAIALDPRHGPRTEAMRRYDTARRLERGVAIARDRARTTAALRDDLQRMQQRLQAAPVDESSDAILDEIESFLGEAGAAPKPTTPDAKKKPAPRRPYRAYRSERGIALWVGKNAVDNDALTIGLAKPHHLFVHVRGQPGSHVILVLDRGQVPDEQSLVDAATLAAHFSSARGESPVEIVYAERRHVRKPKGSAPGSVRVDREKTMLLRMEPARLARLVATER